MNQYSKKIPPTIHPGTEIIYDIECFPNYFSIGYRIVGGRGKGREGVLEISDRRDDSERILNMLEFAHDGWMIGFNNIGYDWMVMAAVVDGILLGEDPVAAAYARSEKIIAAKTPEHKFALANKYHMDRAYHVQQIDLLKIHHFDNKARQTSLKDLEYNFNRKRIQSLPIKPGTLVTHQQMDSLNQYVLEDDVDTTHEFYVKSEEWIKLRQEYTANYNHDFLNLNDTAIGKTYFMLQLKEEGVKLYDEDGKKRQTRYDTLKFADAIFTWHSFKSPEFKAMFEYLRGFESVKQKEIWKDFPTSELGELGNYLDPAYVKKEMTRKGKLFPERIKSLHVRKGDMTFVMGTGGIHASVSKEKFTSKGGMVIDDRDVTSFYPSTIIINELHPKHIGKTYAHIYAWLKRQRLKYPKGTPINKMLKLALNGTFGDSGNEHSSTFDLILMIAITLNGQLALLMLAEELMEIPGLRLIQCNTDGLTMYYHESYKEKVDLICSQWEIGTGYDLEQAIYTRMWVNNVNNYIAEYESKGELKYKLKGAYNYKWEKANEWNKNFSNRISTIAAVEEMTKGVPVEETIENCTTDFYFTLKVRTKGVVGLQWGADPQQNTCRFYVAKQGAPLYRATPQADGSMKLSDAPPMGGRPVVVMNKTNIIGDHSNIDKEWYINKAKELVVT